MRLFAEGAVVHIDISALLARVVASPASSITNIEVPCIAITNLTKNTYQKVFCKRFKVNTKPYASWVDYVIAIHS
jgi:hypothetical protein